MSTYQGMCGSCDASGCCSSPIIISLEAQPTAGQNSSLRSAAVIYNETVRNLNAGGTLRFASNADYNQYKRARALVSGTSRIACRPPPCDAIRQIEATGCPVCEGPISGTVTISELQDADSTGVPTPDGYRYYFDVSWTAFSGATSYSYATTYPSSPLVEPTGLLSIRLFVIWDFGGEFTVTITGVNSCGGTPVSVTGLAPCFLAGSRVTLENGRVLPIEEIRVGDTVLGAFGEINTVLALHRPLLGATTMCRINNEHSTTSHHPHISSDRQFYCLHPSVVTAATYGREHTVINADGQQEKWVLHGLRPDRIQTLRTGIQLKTVEGSRIISSLKEYTLPPDTQLYNLVVGGSHTYHVDDYAVTGWPREDDFDYDSWTIRT